ncbi:DUF3392 family protein [Aliivibrio fischeri]|uniref:DUF3392 domain-containing protein n=1 Tax=Aliivibrio fischeri TaxID=668 RepID=UPI00080EC65C|nr:DUF3392 domain-containing protein [Aliivibrio fischeri]MUK63215.1 DUF3392 family protein [Aliivibrio fischeri]MUK70131.1 DUF3392 family protein [Aliivibrio fischeri]MUK72665.1 DUF3392 family protein [Aliivibrio fischeri]MUK77650.1 DUF3392 family protein [Aliivibrio fischeri]MUL20168.1 DUF3392 family protein [Aliivibrio fischeri]
MNQILSFFNTLGSYLTPYLSDVSVAMIACALVMLGGDINRALRAFLAGKHFLIRTCAFIGINAFGYGLLIVKASPFLTSALRSIQPAFMLAIVFSTFIIIGIWAQKNRQV